MNKHTFGPLCAFLWMTAALSSANASGQNVVDVLVKFQPSVTDEQSAISAIAAGIDGHGGATLREGVWTFRNVPEASIAAIRGGREVAWVERVSAHATTAMERAESAKREPRYHPRVLKVQLNSGQPVTVESAKSTWLPRLRDGAGERLALARVSRDAVSVISPRGATAVQIESLAQRLRAMPEVANVERVRIVRPLQARTSPTSFPLPARYNDPMFPLQWPLHDRDAGINISGAWATAGSSPVTVAVIDTGSTPHPDLDMKWVPGYDFISENFVSVDGDARDADPNDDGDYSDFGECSFWFWGSSWHGTHVAGIIAAQTNNNEGIAGVAPNARIQPIRALGRCGGLEGDIADSIKWAAGVPVDGVPANLNPSKVINLSLGGPGECSKEMQDAVNAAVARNATVVVSAGNDADDAKFYSPANCKGVITVAATSRLADLASYSNSGETIEISAPGGDFDGFQQVVSTLNSGGAGQSTSFYQPYAGTSMAAPHVSGVVALMLSRDPSLTPGQVLNRLQSTVRYGNSAPVGLLDAATAVSSTPDRRTIRQSTVVEGQMRLMELWDRLTNRFVTTGDLHEARALTSGTFGGSWVATDQFADAFDFTANAPSFVVPQPVCRYRSRVNGALRLSADRGVCESLRESAAWINDGWAFQAVLANGNTCAAGTIPMYELTAAGRYRYVWSEFERANSIQFGWSGGNVAFCLPAQ